MEWLLEEDGRWKRVDPREDLDRLLMLARQLTTESAQRARKGRELIDGIQRNLRKLRAHRIRARTHVPPRIM
jgi:hypothetical protein